MVSVNMEIITTRDIARQILRHRSFSFQEFSQRYAVAQNFEFREARMQDHKNRQNSIKTDDSYIKETFNMKQVELLRRIEEVYGWALEVGIAKEQARAILPEGMTQSTMYMNGTLRSWIHYCMLRRANGTQLEHMLIADECWEVLKQHFPSVTEAVDNLG
jgi:thymidylate synthase (FAD)